MDRSLKWRTIFLVLVTLLSLSLLVPTVVPSRDLPLWFNKVFNKKVQLGLDLQGGFHIVYKIDLNRAVDDKATEIGRDLEAKLEEMKLTGKVSTRQNPLGLVVIEMDKPADKARIDEKFLADYADTIDRFDCPQGIDPARSACIRVSADYAERIKISALEQAILTVRERIDERGVAEPTVIKKNDEIIVELPGLNKEDIDRVKDLIERTAKLEFKIHEHARERTSGAFVTKADYMIRLKDHITADPVAKQLGIVAEQTGWDHRESRKEFADWYLMAKDRKEFVTPEQAKKLGCYARDKREVGGKMECEISGRRVMEDYLDELYRTKPELKIDDIHEIGYEFYEPPTSTRRTTQSQPQETEWRAWYLRRAVELGGSAVTGARVIYDPTTSRPEVLVNFTRWGGNRFRELTGANVGAKMAIVLDEKIKSSPIIQSEIAGGSSTITMGTSTAAQAQIEAEDLVAVLQTGSLPAPLEQSASSEIGPLLGQDAVSKAKMSFLIGTALVLLIMIFIYRFSGFLAIIAVILNALFSLALMAAFGATLTLPGIAALVLTVGMAMDANIIIYERIRDELRAGKSIRGSVDAGFHRAVAAIVDGNLTTGSGAYVLYQFGSGPIKGFAVMLMIGIVCNIFTGVWCTRVLFDYYTRGGRRTTIGI